MMTSFHLLRPYMLFAFIPLIALAFIMLSHKQSHSAWNKICDTHLLPYLQLSTRRNHSNTAALLVLAVLTCLILSLSVLKIKLNIYDL